MNGACVALRGPGAGLKSAGLRRGVWMMAVWGPGGCRRERGLVAMVHRVAGFRWLAKKPAGKVLDSCFCRASLVWK